MHKNLLLKILLFTLCSLSFSAYPSEFPVDSQGDLIPSPTGNVNYLRLPQAMGGGQDLYSWTYMGTLINSADQQPLSFEGVITQENKGTSQDAEGNFSGAGFHTFQLGFKDNGDFFYANSDYGGENKVAESLIQSLDVVKSKATLDKFLVSAAPLIMGGQTPTWQFTSLTPSPIAPLYKGLTGQPGHQYRFTATGTTFLWHYTSDGQIVVQNYRYTFSLDLLDERGVVAEGFGGAYSGPALVPAQSSDLAKKTFADYEIGQPRLKTFDWSIQLQALNNSLPDGFKNSYVFRGSDGMLWGDIGPVASEPIQTALTQLPALINRYQPQLAPQFPLSNTASRPNSYSLYNGDWVVVQFTQGKYKGASLTFVPYWNKRAVDPTNFPNTDDPSWCTNGFANLFTGILDHDVASAYTVPEVLIPGNPEFISNPPAHWTNPYTLRYLKMTDPAQYGLLFPWVRQVEVTINPYSQIRYALAAYAHRQNSMVQDNVAEPIHIMITTVSPVAQNILFTNQLTQMYESAAIPEIEGQRVGMAWVEEMIGG